MNSKLWVKWIALFLSAAVLCFGTGCSDDDGGHDPDDDGSGDSTEIENDTTDLADGDQNPWAIEGVLRCLVIGDGISKGVGLETGDPWPTLLRRRLRVEVPVNAIGGAGAADGADKIQDLIGQTGPSHVLILLGEDDVFNGTPLDEIRTHFQTMVDVARLNGVVPVVATLPPMYGLEEESLAFRVEVNEMLRDFADENWVRLADLGAAFGTNRDLIQADGIHPASYGHVLIMESFYEAL